MTKPSNVVDIRDRQNGEFKATGPSDAQHSRFRKCKLTNGEIIASIQTGLVRHYKAVIEDLPNRYGLSEKSWDHDIEGACAEELVAKSFGLHNPHSIGKLHPDIGPFEVRWTKWKTGKLIIHDSEADQDVPYVLCTGSIPNQIVRGWIYAYEAPQLIKRGNFEGYEHRDPSFNVPQDRLRSIYEYDISQWRQ